jgi:hypothetical protein
METGRSNAHNFVKRELSFTCLGHGVCGPRSQWLKRSQVTAVSCAGLVAESVNLHAGRRLRRRENREKRTNQGDSRGQDWDTEDNKRLEQGQDKDQHQDRFLKQN